MRADLRALFEHDHGDLAAFLGGELLQLDRGCEAGGAGADDHHVELHGFAFYFVGHGEMAPSRMRL